MFTITGIAFGIFSICSFLQPFEKNIVFWISYLLGSLAIVGQIYTFQVSFQHGSLRSKVYGLPIAKLSLMYLVAQMVLSAIGMRFASVFSWQVSLAGGSVLLGLFGIGMITHEGVREERLRQDMTIAVNTSMFRSLQEQVNTLVPYAPSETLKAKMEVLNREFKYSDPVSGEQTEALEHQLQGFLTQLRQWNVSEEASYLQLIAQITNVLEQRNMICKTTKKK